MLSQGKEKQQIRNEIRRFYFGPMLAADRGDRRNAMKWKKADAYFRTMVSLVTCLAL
jgi:hypothetical protein